MAKFIKLLSCIIFIYPWVYAEAEDRIVLVGGGPTATNSEVSIELNVEWVKKVLSMGNVDAELSIYFTSGSESSADIKEWVPATNQLESLQPLARVFGSSHENGYKYRSNNIQGINGGTTREELIPELTSLFGTLGNSDNLLFLFYGHGLNKGTQETGNTLRLWESTELSVQETRELFDEVDRSVSIRFVLPQCYSGGFERLIYQDAARKGTKLAAGEICGFMSVARDEQSEGCTISVDTNDYRDYTSFFFNALAGEDRSGSRLLLDPDTDSDGKVSFLEAHHYALAEAKSTDIPRSTSETFLERWEPWYLRWYGGSLDVDNMYINLASRISDKYEFFTDKRKLDKQVFERIRDTKKELDALEDNRDRLAANVENLQDDIKKEMYFKWPATRYPYTKGFSDFLRDDVLAAQEFIMQHKQYRKLIDAQMEHEQINHLELNKMRDLAQLRRIFRLRRLGLLLAHFEESASESDKASYNKILACEQAGLKDM